MRKKKKEKDLKMQFLNKISKIKND